MSSTSQIIAHDFAVRQHLLKNPSCASQYSDTKFSIFARGRSSFHLSALKATYQSFSIQSMSTQRISLQSKTYSLLLILTSNWLLLIRRGFVFFFSIGHFLSQSGKRFLLFNIITSSQ